MAGQHRATTPPPALSFWLGNGAVALGIGAALTTGAAVASADIGETGGTTSSSQSSGTSAGPTAKRTAPRSVATARTHRTPSPKADVIEDEATGLTSSAARLSTAKTTASAAAGFNPFAALEKTFRKSFLNTAPTIAGSSGPTGNGDGTYTGQVIGTDVDDDPLTYSIGIAPKRGTASVDADGNYTYVPDAELAASGGTVAFYVHAEEANAGTHLHGFNEFTARLFDPLFRLLNSLVPQNRYQFPTYHASTYARAQHYVRVIIPPAV